MIERYKGILTRLEDNGIQTLGELCIYDGINNVFRCKTLELPWKDNKRNISCVLDGTYLAKPFNSPSKGKVYKLEYVMDRTYIEIHVANFFFDLAGCIAVGEKYIDINRDGYLDVVNSGKTMSQFLNIMDNNELLLTIKTI
jgi:hypothetical protein